MLVGVVAHGLAEVRQAAAANGVHLVVRRPPPRGAVPAVDTAAARRASRGLQQQPLRAALLEP